MFYFDAVFFSRQIKWTSQHAQGNRVPAQKLTKIWKCVWSIGSEWALLPHTCLDRVHRSLRSWCVTKLTRRSPPRKPGVWHESGKPRVISSTTCYSIKRSFIWTFHITLRYKLCGLTVFLRQHCSRDDRTWRDNFLITGSHVTTRTVNFSSLK